MRKEKLVNLNRSFWHSIRSFSFDYITTDMNKDIDIQKYMTSGNSVLAEEDYNQSPKFFWFYQPW